MPQERRLVTVLFADIVDSSGSVSSHDPEVTRGALAATFTRAREILVSHGGTVEKFIGDAIMAVFGLPIAHEDDAERAVRAGLVLREAGSDGRPDVLRFTFRIGINSGEVVTGDGPMDEFLVTGSPVVVGARLEQAAAPGEILVGPLTRELTRRSVEYGEPRSIVAKGMGVVEARPVVGVAAVGPREPGAGAFVGRTAELQLLKGFVERAAATTRAHLVTITGDPGVGKSRLLGELLRRTKTRALRAACLPYGRAITYWPVQELIRHDAGIVPTDDLSTARAKIASVAGPPEADPAEVVETLREVSAIALSGRPDASGDVPVQPRELARALRRYIEWRVRAQPAILVIEDLHWAEDALLDLIDELLVQVRVPVLIACAARRELLERRPSWGGGRSNALAIELDPLPDGDAERLAGELLGDPTDRRIPGIVARTEGNPLFLEEYVRVLSDQRPEDMPATLHGVIAARLDAAPAPLRRVLQEASVLGRDFWLDALPGDPPEGDRGALIEDGLRRDLVMRSPRPGPSGSPTYRFRHGLIRDVAYASLSKADRSVLHDHYATWLAEAPGERSEDYADIGVFHSERAFELARELGIPSLPDLGQRAFQALSRSASLAWARADFQLALDLYLRAIGIADLIGFAGRDRVVAQGMAAMARVRLESSDAAIAELDRAIEAARGLGPTEHLVWMLAWRASITATLDDILGARALYAEATDVARRTGDPDAIAYSLRSSSEPAQLIGQLHERRRLLEEALAHMRSTGADHWLVACVAELSATSLELGETDAARAQAEEAVAIADRSGRRLDRFRARDALARALLAAGDPRAREVAERALAVASEIGGIGPLAHVAEVVGEALERSGEPDAAEALLSDTLAMLDPVAMPTQRAAIARLQAIRARLALGRQDLDAAAAAANTAMQVAPRSNAAARVVALLAAGTVACARGRTVEARRLADEAEEILKRTDIRTLWVPLDRLSGSLSPVHG